MLSKVIGRRNLRAGLPPLPHYQKRGMRRRIYQSLRLQPEVRRLCSFPPRPAEPQVKFLSTSYRLQPGSFLLFNCLRLQPEVRLPLEGLSRNT